MISDSQPVYQLTRNNTVLLIQGQGSSVIGTYEARVMTSQGENSVFINITYPGILYCELMNVLNPITCINCV